MGAIGLMAVRWPRSAQVGAAGALAFVYGVWGLQNLRLVLVTDRYGPLMWGHVIACLAIGVLCAVHVFRLRTAPVTT